jgi:hypothetical protein
MIVIADSTKHILPRIKHILPRIKHILPREIQNRNEIAKFRIAGIETCHANAKHFATQTVKELPSDCESLIVFGHRKDVENYFDKWRSLPTCGATPSGTLTCGGQKGQCLWIPMSNLFLSLLSQEFRDFLRCHGI